MENFAIFKAWIGNQMEVVSVTVIEFGNIFPNRELFSASVVIFCLIAARSDFAPSVFC